ncbi:MAG: hypothetical protein IPF82_13615 [Blastocatellia bacterium]|nr:hypothetical protein [Blastocatellia bacterium]
MFEGTTSSSSSSSAKWSRSRASIGDANRAKIGSTPVKQFRMKLVRRKAGPSAAATNAAAAK